MKKIFLGLLMCFVMLSFAPESSSKGIKAKASIEYNMDDGCSFPPTGPYTVLQMGCAGVADELTYPMYGLLAPEYINLYWNHYYSRCVCPPSPRIDWEEGL